MSSTYSPDLRIELIGTGDQAGVWGATTNNNLAYVLEQAIAGYISVAVSSANQALTYINGGSSNAALNQSVSAAIALTTSTGANFAVYAPPVSKQYTIYNSSLYTATIYNSTVIGNTTAAGTGVAVPAGKTMTVWSDGTNFAQQNTHLISPTLASPAMSGTPTAPTASAGTSTTQVATTAFMATMYPVGSIYSSTVSTNPGTLFGFGTWVAFGAGRVLIGDGGGYTAGSTGGSADAIVVSHTHTASSSSSFTGSAGTTGTQSADHTHGVSATTSGQSQTHSHSISISDPGHAHTIYNGSNLNSSVDNGGVAGTVTPITNFNTTNTATTGISASAGNASVDHTHSFSTTSTGVSANHTHSFTPAGSVSTSTSISSTGSSGTGANLQPYVVVYMWNRTA
jgi:hypothetical protein